MTWGTWVVFILGAIFVGLLQKDIWQLSKIIEMQKAEIKMRERLAYKLAMKLASVENCKHKSWVTDEIQNMDKE
ncbi:gp60 [Brochothrix phage BL3]|uniref:gp60 n=1 Tax=Brochothrix phage BL3 TaxID=764562 RepID=UPI0001D9AEE7|nr:gp60 [Brochothrix phage BL3]ADH03141.1 gp60 [Brochothrix phage BL3]